MVGVLFGVLNLRAQKKDTELQLSPLRNEFGVLPAEGLFFSFVVVVLQEIQIGILFDIIFLIT